MHFFLDKTVHFFPSGVEFGSGDSLSGLHQSAVDSGQFTTSASA